MKSYKTLPDGYNQIFAVNLQKDKSKVVLINVAAVLITLVMAIPMHFHISFFTIFDMSNGFGAYALRFLVLLAGIFAYIVLHELVHGVSMKICGTDKVKYGFTGIYAFAGSDDYYTKKSYIFIALAPVVVWGVILAVINAFVSETWFWIVYIIQISNISGAAGDFYVTVKFLKFPDDILVHDNGVSMEVFSKEIEL